MSINFFWSWSGFPTDCFQLNNETYLCMNVYVNVLYVQSREFCDVYKLSILAQSLQMYIG